MRTSKKGTAADPFGWFPEHWEALAGSGMGRRALALFFNAVLAGNLGAPLLSAGTMSNTTMLAKPGNGIRPISVGASFRRMALRVLVKAQVLEIQLAAGDK